MSVKMCNPSYSVQSHRRPTGFTLVELLVVIGIIALLISILLPGLNKARQAANQTKCMANLRSIGQAMFIYTTVHKGMLPYGIADPTESSSVGVVYNGPLEHWDTLLLGTMTSARANSQYVSVGTGTPGSRAIFTCPQVDNVINGTGRILHYSAHPLLFPNIKAADRLAYFQTRTQKGLQPYKMSKIKRPAEIAGIFDGSVRDLTFGANATAVALNKYAISGSFTTTMLYDDYDRTNPSQNAGTPVDMTPKNENGVPAIVNGDGDSNVANIRFRHSGNTKANALMMDGHVESFNFKKGKPVTDCTDMTLRNICVPRQ